MEKSIAAGESMGKGQKAKEHAGPIVTYRDGTKKQLTPRLRRRLDPETKRAMLLALERMDDSGLA